MSYSDLLARQDKELELLNQRFYADQVMLRKLQGDHYDQTRYAGQQERLQADFERQRDALQTRFEQEQKTHLNEPDQPQAETKPDISESQDKAVNMLRQSQWARAQQKMDGSSPKPVDTPAPSAYEDDGNEALTKMMEDTRRRREAWKYRRGGHKR